MLFAVYADEQTRPDLLPRDIVETTIITQNYTGIFIWQIAASSMYFLCRGKATRRKKQDCTPPLAKEACRVLVPYLLRIQGEEIFRSCLSGKIESTEGWKKGKINKLFSPRRVFERPSLSFSFEENI